jgi:GntR family transcriptional regulator, rspAB operon transcriptional repressor
MAQTTASDTAYQILRDKILFLELEPGAVLQESVLMEQLHLGRSPIRDALRRLQQEDLIVILPRQGTLVAGISFAEFHEIFELRLELEGFAAYLAAQRARPIHLQSLEELLAQAESQAAADSDRLNIGIDRNFHEIIAEACGNRFLRKRLRELFHHSIRLFNLSRTRSASVGEEIPDYQAFYQALKERESERARTLIQEHILASQERIRASFTPLAIDREYGSPG